VNRRNFLAALAAFSATPRFLFARTQYLVRFPYIQGMGPDRASILWATRDHEDAFVEVSNDGRSYSGVAATARIFAQPEIGNLAPFIQYQADLSGLSADTMYVYRVSTGGEYLAQGRFRTPGSGPFKFLAIGDSGQRTSAQYAIASRIASEDPSFLIHAGDMAYMDGNHQEFQVNHFDVYNGVLSSVPLFTTPGNHEYLTEQAQPYLSAHSVPTRTVPVADRGRYYSFDWGNVHFVCLDSNTPLRFAVTGTGEMLQWLERDLRATRQFWRVAFMHHPPYAGGPNQLDTESVYVRESVVPILEAHGVQFVLSGHEHSFQRSKSIHNGSVVGPNTGTVYITSGGGGAALYPVFANPLIANALSAHHYLKVEVDGARMAITAIEQSGSVIDSTVISPLPTLANNTHGKAFNASPSGRGSLIQISGTALAAQERFADSAPEPTQLAGTSVSINGQPARLLYVSGSRIRAHIPSPVEGSCVLRITNANGSTEAVV
jgi:hypothetical protein